MKRLSFLKLGIITTLLMLTSFTGKVLAKDKFKPGIFCIDGIGYNGPEQSVVNKLTRITIKPSSNDTEEINNAIIKASHKGGQVIITTGNYNVGPLVLKSNVHIRIEEGVLLSAKQSNIKRAKATKEVFVIGRTKSIKNVSIIGEGAGDNRPRIKYIKEGEDGSTGTRAFSIGSVENLFIQNVVIEDEQTKFSGVAFTFKKGDYSENGRARNVTVDHVEQTNAAYGYGLIQTNTGANMLLSNLVCSGGVCARIETDNRHNVDKIKIGVDNIHIKNVVSKNGKAAVYLKPHNLKSGNVFIDGAHAFNSQFAIEIRGGSMGKETDGSFGSESYIKNVSAVYGLATSVHYSGRNSIPNCLLPYFKKNISVDAQVKGAKQGPSICVIGDYMQQIDIDTTTVSASVPADETNPDNTVEARSLIVNGTAFRGNNPDKQCGEAAYEM